MYCWTREDWPRIALHRGPRAIPGRYFGPPGRDRGTRNAEPDAQAAKLRSCEDSVFRNRSRPCLQYQIGRCSAPCVELVAPAEYAESVRRAALFLEGKSDELTRELGEQMQAARHWSRPRACADLILAAQHAVPASTWMAVLPT